MTRGERIIAVWDIVLQGARYPVTVYLIDHAAPYSGTEIPHDAKVHFRAEYKGADLRLRDVNIDALRKKVEEHLRTWASIEWKLHLYVKTEVGNAKIEFDYSWVAIGERRDGKMVHADVGSPSGCGPFCEDKSKDHIHDQGVDEDKGTWSGRWDPGRYGFHVTEGLPDTGTDSKRHSYSPGRMLALVPATQETYRACWRFAAALDLIGKQIQDRFTPTEVEATLADIVRSMPQLPPKEDPARAEEQ